MLHRVLGVKTGRSRAPKNRKMGKIPNFRCIRQQTNVIMSQSLQHSLHCYSRSSYQSRHDLGRFFERKSTLVEFNQAEINSNLNKHKKHVCIDCIVADVL